MAGNSSGRAAVQGLPHPGVDNELGDGILVVDVQDGPELLRVLDTQTGLDRDGSGGGGEDVLQQVVQFLRPPQHPGPLPLGGDGAGGAAQVQVDLPVAHPGQLTCRPEKVRPAPGEQLGHHIQVPVLLRQDVPQLPAGEHVVLAGGEKGHEIPVHPREEPAVGPAEQGSCDPLHGGEQALHSRPHSGRARGRVRAGRQALSGVRGNNWIGFIVVLLPPRGGLDCRPLL